MSDFNYNGIRRTIDMMECELVWLVSVGNLGQFCSAAKKYISVVPIKCKVIIAFSEIDSNGITKSVLYLNFYLKLFSFDIHQSSSAFD